MPLSGFSRILSRPPPVAEPSGEATGGGLDKIREKPDKVIKPLTFLMSTVVFLMRARSDPIKYHCTHTL